MIEKKMEEIKKDLANMSKEDRQKMEKEIDKRSGNLEIKSSLKHRKIF